MFGNRPAMSKEDQSNFMDSILQIIIGNINDDMEKDRIPHEWTGVELRQYIVDTANDVCQPERYMTKEARKSYEAQRQSLL